MSNLMSADQAASAAAEAMFGKSGGGGGMPLAQGDAEGGLSSKAPGKPMASKAKKAGKPEDEEDEKKAPPWAKKSMAKAEDEEDEEEGEEKESPEKEKREEAAAEKKDAKERGEPSEDEDEEKSDDGDADDMKKKKACKSSVDERDLMKALDVLEAVAGGVDAPDRRSELAEKLAQGTIEKSEEGELRDLLGEEQQEEELDKSFTEIFANDDQLRTDYEISPFIERNSQLMAEGLDFLRASLEKSSERQGSFNVALAKSFRSIGQTVLDQMDLIKSQQGQIRALSERLGIVESTPMPRKSASGTRPLAKSFAGGNENQIGREQIMDGLNRLMAKSSRSNFLAPCGESIERAVAMYETSGVISKSLLKDVQEELQTK